MLSPNLLVSISIFHIPGFILKVCQTSLKYVFFAKQIFYTVVYNFSVLSQDDLH
jgi:hypothetical protein